MQYIKYDHSKESVPLKVLTGSCIIIINAVVWYMYGTATMQRLIAYDHNSELLFCTFLFCGGTLSLIIGALISNRLTSRKCLFLYWTIIGILSSITLLTFLFMAEGIISVLAFLLSFSFGFGLPSALAQFADVTEKRNRAKVGALVTIIMFLGILFLYLILTDNLVINTLILALWRNLGLIGVVLLWNDPKNKIEQNKRTSFTLLRKTVLYYFIPWLIFSLVYYFGLSISYKIYGEEFANFSTNVEILVTGISALLSGFVADRLGRKKILLGGFILLGSAYAILGMAPFEIYAWYLHTFFSGIAWGIFYVIFWFTIWGDLADESSSESYYALGLLPYALSGFLRVVVGSWVAEFVSPYAVFSFVAFLLFLAVVPLMYAPETLPESVIKEWELKRYIEKAKRVREKFT